MVKEFEKLYPGCWQLADDIRSARGKELPDWDDLCYIPIAGARAIMKDYGNYNLDDASLLQALSGWRHYKEIYSFSEELAETLYEQAEDDIIIPVEILKSIPYPCIYITTGGNEGFFACFECDVEAYTLELRFCIIEDGKLINTWLHIREGYTISDGINEGIDLCIKNMDETKISLFDAQSEAEYYYDKIAKRIQLLLYICAENAEVEENAEQKKITKKPAKGAKPKDAFREIRKWDVGVRFAKKIKKYKSSEVVTEITENSETEVERQKESPTRIVRPHTRRGHWHHYWVGSNKDNSRKLILKWTAPVFVGGGSEDTITTINERK